MFFFFSSLYILYAVYCLLLPRSFSSHCGLFFNSLCPSILPLNVSIFLTKHNLMDISQNDSGRLTCMFGSSSLLEYVEIMWNKFWIYER